MTTTLKISTKTPGEERPVGGLIGAITGGTTTGPASKTTLEITFEEENGSESAGWVQEIADVAAVTLRTAVLGERMAEPVAYIDEPQTLDEQAPQVGAVITNEEEYAKFPFGTVLLDKDGDPQKIGANDRSLHLRYQPLTVIWIPEPKTADDNKEN